MDFTFLTWSEVFRLVVPVPEVESRLFAFVRPFHPTVNKGYTKVKPNSVKMSILLIQQVWLLILITSIVLIGMMSYFAWIYKHHYKTSEDDDDDKKTPVLKGTPFYLSANTMYIINILTNQGRNRIFYFVLI